MRPEWNSPVLNVVQPVCMYLSLPNAFVKMVYRFVRIAGCYCYKFIGGGRMGMGQGKFIGS